MTLGQTALRHPSLAGLIETLQARFSRVALHGRFCSSAVEFLQACLALAWDSSARQKGIEPDALKAFPRVHIFDSSSWDIHPTFKKILPGYGGGASAANCKVQAGYEYKSGHLGFLKVTEGIQPDQAYSDELVDLVEPGELMLTDLGYFKLATFCDLIAKGVFFLSRFLVGTALRDASTQERIDLGQQLKRTKESVLEWNVWMGKKSQVGCRLIALRATEPIARARRTTLRRKARERGHTPSQQHLALCDWPLFVTNAPAQILPCKRVHALYRLRWQIELVFKQLKSVLRIHTSSTTNLYRLQCELYGKLIMAVILHRLHASLNFLWWKSQGREISFDKLYKRIQERAFTLLRGLLTGVKAALKHFHRELQQLAARCVKIRQPSRKTTLELLENLAESPA